MSRDFQRAINDAAADHALVKRDSSGTVQTSTAQSGTGFSTTGSAQTTFTSFTLSGPPNLVLGTEGTVTVGAAATGGTTVKLVRNGGTSTVTTVSGSGTSTFGVNTHTTPLNAPSYSLTISPAGNSASVSFSLSREDRWA